MNAAVLRAQSGCRNGGGNFLPTACVQNSEAAVTDDGQLIHETLAGKTMAYGQLVQKYQDRLYNTMVHVVGSAEDARDIVQDAFVQAFVKLETFRQTSTFYTWLYRIAFNAAVTEHRRKKPATSVEHLRATRGEEPVDGRNGPAEQLEQQERCRQVQQAIAALGEEYRAILVLREIDGCCYETIAEVLNLPIGTVRSRLHRARLQLRESLKERLMIED